MAWKAKNRTQSSELRTKNFIFCLLSAVFCILIISGCEEASQKSQIQTSKQNKPVLKSTLDRQDAALKAENEQLKKQIETLMGIDRPARIEAVSTASSIELTDRCGIYDKDDNGSKEILVIYMRVIDDMGDCVKAPGAVKIELWNLNAKPQEARLKTWQIEPAELKNNWSGSLLTSYYKLKLDISSLLPEQTDELTVKAEFTDYLTGKILRAQQVVK